MIPTKFQVRAAREAAHLTQPTAAAIVHLRSFQRWAEYEQGRRRIDLARWELFLIKTGQHAKATVINGMVVIPRNMTTEE